MGRANPELDIAGAIDRHFERMDQRTYDQVMDLADMLGETATAGLRSTSPDSIITMPVSMLDETKMGDTLELLRPAPFRVTSEAFGVGMLSGAGAVGRIDDRYWTNVSGNSTAAGIVDPFSGLNFGPVVDCVEGEPDVPMSFFFNIYKPKTPICTVRADLGDASIELYRRFCEAIGEPPQDIMMANFDADTRDLMLLGDSATYMHRLAQARKRSSATYLEAYPDLAHQEIDEKRFPRIQRLIKWRDYMNGKFRFSFAAHYAVNLFGYLDVGGYNREWDNNEQLQMGRALAARAAETGNQMQSKRLDGVVAIVSPRRYMIELMNGEHMGYGALKVPEEGQRVHVDPENLDDLSDKRFKEEVEYEVHRLCERGLEKFEGEYRRQHPRGSRSDALDYAFARVEELIKQEAKGDDAPDLKGMKRIILRALADFTERIDELKENSDA